MPPKSKAAVGEKAEMAGTYLADEISMNGLKQITEVKWYTASA